MSNKTIAVGTVIIVISFITIAVLFVETYATLQTFNPVAVLAAITVALIGLVWFKKTIKS